MRDCALSPDGPVIFTVGDDAVLKAADRAAAAVLATLPLLGRGLCVASHPHLMRVLCGDVSGGIYLTELVAAN